MLRFDVYVVAFHKFMFLWDVVAFHWGLHGTISPTRWCNIPADCILQKEDFFTS